MVVSPFNLIFQPNQNLFFFYHFDLLHRSLANIRGLEMGQILSPGCDHILNAFRRCLGLLTYLLYFTEFSIEFCCFHGNFDRKCARNYDGNFDISIEMSDFDGNFRTKFAMEISISIENFHGNFHGNFDFAQPWLSFWKYYRGVLLCPRGFMIF